MYGRPAPAVRVKSGGPFALSRGRPALGLSRAEQARLLGLPLRTYQRRLKEGRLQAREVPAAEFLPALYEEAVRGFGDSGRAQEWLTGYVPALGARPVDLLGDLEGYQRVQAVLGSALYGFL